MSRKEGGRGLTKIEDCLDASIQGLKCKKRKKPVQREYKTRQDWVRNMIHWKLCKKLESEYTTKWYIHKPESVLKNETHKVLWDIEIQTDPQIPTR